MPAEKEKTLLLPRLADLLLPIPSNGPFPLFPLVGGAIYENPANYRAPGNKFFLRAWHGGDPFSSLLLFRGEGGGGVWRHKL